MLKVGVTGGIGSGKTLICSVFEKFGVPVFNADRVAKNIINNDREVVLKFKELFGDDIYTDNQINSKKLADIIFNNKEIIQQVNSIIHPKVREYFIEWSSQYQIKPYVIQEAAILFESNAYKQLDFTINVQASKETRLKRVMLRDNVSKEKVIERMSNQLSDEQRVKLANFTIDNENNTMILPQIIEIHNKLIKENK
ncbi:MAG: dephospho-CoA kinase [Bacteroidales bacterium]